MMMPMMPMMPSASRVQPNMFEGPGYAWWIYATTPPNKDDVSLFLDGQWKGNWVISTQEYATLKDGQWIRSKKPPVDPPRFARKGTKDKTNPFNADNALQKRPPQD